MVHGRICGKPVTGSWAEMIESLSVSSSLIIEQPLLKTSTLSLSFCLFCLHVVIMLFLIDINTDVQKNNNVRIMQCSEW